MKTVRISWLLLLISAIGLSGCLTVSSLPEQITSLNVGCKNDQIKISDESVELNGTENWIAECNGKKYSCSYLPESGSDCYEVIE